MNKHVGSNFDDFLKKEGMLAESEAAAVERIDAYLAESNRSSADRGHTGTADVDTARLTAGKNCAAAVMSSCRVGLRGRRITNISRT